MGRPEPARRNANMGRPQSKLSLPSDLKLGSSSRGVDSSLHRDRRRGAPYPHHSSPHYLATVIAALGICLQRVQESLFFIVTEQLISVTPGTRLVGRSRSVTCRTVSSKSRGVSRWPGRIKQAGSAQEDTQTLAATTKIVHHPEIELHRLSCSWRSIEEDRLNTMSKTDDYPHPSGSNYDLCPAQGP